MSANNFILINRQSLDITMRDADTGSVYEKIGKGKSLEDAVDIAQDYLDKEIVEYGIILSKKRKRV